MGTNFYLVKNRATITHPIHIGKSSLGWLFNFQPQNERWNDPPIIWNTWPQVRDVLKRLTVDSKDYAIVDEYDNILSYDNFVEMVEYKQRDPRNLNNPDNFRYSRNVDGYRFTDGDFL